MYGIINKLGDYCFEANEYLNSVADGFSYKVSIPLIAGAYQYGSEAVAQVGGLFSNALKTRLRDAAEDPWSTRTILVALTPVEVFTQFIAEKVPTKLPGIHFLDQSITSISQHLYTYMKEVNELLSVPDNMRAFLNTFSIGAIFDQSAQMGGDVGKVVSKTRRYASTILFFVLDQVIWAVDLIFQVLFSSTDIKVLGYLKEVIHAGRQKLQGTISDHANSVIHDREKRIRSQLVGAVANATNEFMVTLTNRVAFKTLLGLGAYSLLEMGLSPTIPAPYLRTIVGATTASLLWINVYQPFLQEYYDAYNPKFNPDACHLRDFLSFHEYRELYLPLHGTKKFFQNVEQS